MHWQLAEKIYKRCPTIYRGRNLGPDQNLMCFGFECGSGWYELILDLSIQLEKITEKLRADGMEPNYLPMVMQVKEKYGGLSFSLTYYTDEMNVLIDKAEEDSLTTCEECGAEGKLMSVYGRFQMTCCEEHLPSIVSHSETSDV